MSCATRLRLINTTDILWIFHPVFSREPWNDKKALKEPKVLLKKIVSFILIVKMSIRKISFSVALLVIFPYCRICCNKIKKIYAFKGYRMVLQFESARKIWPVLELLAKIRWVLACSCSQNFCNCSHAQIFVNSHLAKQKLTLETMFPECWTGKHWRNMCAPLIFSGKLLPRFADV